MGSSWYAEQLLYSYEYIRCALRSMSKTGDQIGFFPINAGFVGNNIYFKQCKAFS